MSKDILGFFIESDELGGDVCEGTLSDQTA